MRNILIIFIGSLLPMNLIAQSTPQTAIYSLEIAIDESFRNYTSIESANRVFTQAYSEFLEIPDQMLDSMKTTAAQLIGDYLGETSTVVYTKNKKGRKIVTTGEKDFVMGMPNAKLAEASKQFRRAHYVAVYARIKDGNFFKADQDVSNNYKAKPIIEVEITFHDRNKKLQERKKVKLKNFGKVSQKVYDDRWIRSGSAQLLSTGKIFLMYRRGIEAALLDAS